MILKRLSEGIKNQDWFVVIIEIMIVVVGIFIGLQVDAWNESRKERAIEASYLQRLTADLEADLVQFSHGIRLSEERRGLGEFLIASVADRDLVQRNPTLFMQALVKAGFTFSPSISEHTFEEIKSSGNLDLIRDVAIRSGLTRYYTTIRASEQWGYIREQKQTEYLLRSRGIMDYDQERLYWGNRDDVQFSSEAALEAYDRMLAKHAYLEWLPMVANREQEIEDYSGWDRAAHALLVAINGEGYKRSQN